MGTILFLSFWPVSASACPPLRCSRTNFSSLISAEKTDEMTPQFQAPRPLRPRVYLPANQLLRSSRPLTAVKSHPYLKTGGWGAKHELLHQLVLILLVCFFVFEIVGCAGGLKGGTTPAGTGSGSSTGGGSTGGTTTIPATPT